MKKVLSLLLCLLVFISFQKLSSQDLWQQLSGPYGGYVNKILSSPSGALYAVSSSGVYKSMNEGGTWMPVTPSSIKDITCGCISPNGYIYIGIGNFAPKVYRSTDEGSSWTLRNTGTMHDFCDMAVTPGGTVLAGTAYRFSFHTQFIQSGEIFRSVDNGNTFTITPFPDIAVGSISANTNGDVYVTSTNGLFRSVNSGASWSVIRNDTCSKVFTNISGHIFFSTRQGVLRSTNNGASWLGVPKVPMASGSGGILFTAESGNIFKSTDNGDTWNQISVISGSSSFGTNSLLFSGVSKIYAGSNFGVFKSNNNGDNWAEANTGIRVTNIFTVVSKGTNIFAGSDRYISRSTDNGNEWTNLSNGLPPAGTRMLKLSPNSSIFAYIYGSGIYRSVNNGDNWTKLNNLPAGISEGSMVFNSSSEIFATAIDKIYKSSNNGDTWTEITSGFPEDTTTNIYGLSIDHQNNLYASISWGEFIFNYGLFKSTNNGANWSQISNERAPGQLKFNSQNQIWGIITTGLKLSTNGGMNFQAVTSAPSYVIDLEMGNQDQIFLHYVQNEIYGIKRSTNNGNSWTEYNQGLGQLLVYDMEFDDNNRLIAGTQSGLFRTIDATVGLPNYNSQIPSAYSLYQNYPNPFNPETKIQFSIPVNAFTKLSVYNSIGEEVGILVNDNLKTGTYEYSWKAENFPSGVYFYRLLSGDFTSAKKMVLVK